MGELDALKDLEAVNKMSVFTESLKSLESLTKTEAPVKREHCYTCGGHGFKDKVCPECGLNPHETSKPKLTREQTIAQAKELQIPAIYENSDWKKEILLDTSLEHKNNANFIRWAEQLEKIHGMFVKGILPAKSAIVIAPPSTGKVTWAYSCMKYAKMNGLSVAPLLDSQEVKRLLVLSAERPRQVLFGITYEDYVASDVLFMTVTKTNYREEAYSIIEELLDKRSRRGLPTFIISRYSMQTMAKRDWEDNFVFVQDSNPARNFLKFPVIIPFNYVRAKSTKGV